MKKVRIEDLVDRDGMIKSAKKYGVSIRKDLSSKILKLHTEVEWQISSLQQVKDNQERWYPFVGITVEELDEFKEFLEKKVTIFRNGSQK